MASIDITVTGNFTLDESGGLDSGADGTPNGSARNDSDVNVSTLPAAFSSYLFTDPAGLQLSNAFPTADGVAASSTTFIHVAAGSPLSTLGLTQSDGTGFDGTQASGVSTADGHDIYLLSALNGQVVLGVYDSDDVDPDLDAVAFAVYLKTDGTLGTSEDAQLWTVTFTALDHPISGDQSTTDAFDDAVDLLQNVYVHATGALDIKFDSMPSSANLFNDAAESAAGGGVIVFGENIVVSGSGKYTNASDTIHTSQGGDGATIGVNNQMFDPGDGAYFTFVRDIDDRYLSGTKGGLSSTEADYQQNMLYDSLIESKGASIHISQTQGNNNAGMTITAYHLASAYQGSQLIAHAGDNQVDIDAVYVWDSTHTTLLESYTNGAEDDLDADIGIDVASGVASLTGLDDGMIVEWHTVSDHNQVLIQDTAGAWDLGGFGITEGAEDTESLAGHAFVEDDHPSFTTPISDGTIDYDSGATPIHHSLNEDAGTDGLASSAITYFTPNVDFLGIHLIGVDVNSDGQTIQYIQDTDGNGTIDSGETKVFYTMDLTTNPGEYTFTVNNAPAAPPLTFNFDNLPSGSNLFGSVAQDADGAGIFVFGENIDLNNATKYTNASDNIKTSQGGIGATIGVNNQMFDTGEGAFFTFVDDIRDDFLANGALNGLTSTEADYGKNILYDDGLHETDGAFLGVSQIQAGSTASMAITAFLLDPGTAPQGVNLINASGQSGDAVDIFNVSVYQGSVDPANLLETTNSSGVDGGMNPNITVSIDSDGVAHVSGLSPGMVVAWSVDDPSTLGVEEHNQVLIQAEGGKFDVGLFGFQESQQIPDQTLDFTVTQTDGDGDHIADSFQVDVNAV